MSFTADGDWVDTDPAPIDHTIRYSSDARRLEIIAIEQGIAADQSEGTRALYQAATHDSVYAGDHELLDTIAKYQVQDANRSAWCRRMYAFEAGFVAS